MQARSTWAEGPAGLRENFRCTKNYLPLATKRVQTSVVPRMREVADVDKTTGSNAALAMGVGPPEPPRRRRFQTAASCAGSMAGVVNVAETAPIEASGASREDERE